MYTTKGFTLIELLIYISISAIVLTLASGFVLNIIEGDTTSAVFREVQQNGRQALNIISQYIKQATSINNISATSLELAMFDPNLNPALIELNSDKIQITLGQNTAYDLTNRNVKVTNLTFTDLSYPDLPATIRTEMNLEYNEPNNRSQYQSSISLKSTVVLSPYHSLNLSIATSTPQSSGDTNQLRRSGCAENWQCVDDPETGDDDTTYVYARRNESRFDLYQLTDLSIEPEESIVQLTIYFRCRRQVSGDPTMTAALYLLTNGSTAEGTVQVLTDSYWLYSETYATNPMTNFVWTQDQVNNLQIGLHLEAFAPDREDQARCTQVWTEVEYGVVF